MAEPLSDVVSLTITSDSVGVARASFGVPLILSHSATWTERTRTYSSALEVAADFTVDSPEYLAALAMFSQNPHPETVKIGRAALQPTMKYVLAATATNSTAYAIKVTGKGVTETDILYTSDSTGTLAEIHFGLVTALNAVTGKNYTATYAPLVYADAVFTADNATEIFTSAAHGLLTGDGPFQVSNGGGGLPTGLSAVTDYWVIKIDANTFYLADSLAHAIAGTHLSISTNGTGTQTISDTANTVSPTGSVTVTGSAAANWFSLAVGDTSLIDIKMTHADPGVATDLAAISVKDDDWYVVVTLFNSQQYIDGVADAIEAVRKQYVAATCDTYAQNIAYVAGDSNDAGAEQHSDAAARTSLIFHPSPADFADAAWVGAVLPLDPGSATWKFKTLSGVSPVTMTSTQRANLRARKMNSYESMAGLNKTWEGTVADGEFIDIIQGIDFIYDDMTKRVFEALAGLPKVAFDDDGIALIEAEVRGTLKLAVDMGILTADPKFVVTVPKASAVSKANKAIRNLTPIKWKATLDGAVHHVGITGVVSV